MKITKTAEKVQAFEKAKMKANAGCEVCPCCGETQSVGYYISKGFLHRGISSGLCKTWVKGIFKIKNMHVDCYRCYTCGAEWESEPYEYE